MAFSQPGMPLSLPAAADGAPSNPWLAAVLLTLLDHETSFDAIPSSPLEDFVRARTAARVAPADTADFVLATTGSITSDAVSKLKRGSLAYPDDSATLVVDVAAPAPLTRLQMSGPGIPQKRDVDVPLSTQIVRALEAANADYPCGVDVLLVNADGLVMALPRSVRFGDR